MQHSLSKRFLAVLLVAAGAAQAAPSLIAIGTLDRPADLSGLTAPVESGLPGDNFGGIGSGLAWAGGNRFLAIPDRGPNATPYPNGPLIDNTTSYISRWHTVELDLAAVPSGSLPFTLSASLTGTTPLYSDAPLIYGATSGLPSAVPSVNTAGKYYFTGRSDNFLPGLSTHSDFARFDPEGVRLSRDGKSVFISDEYGPYVYQFDRLTGKRIRSFNLPDHFAIPNLSSLGAAEISGNSIGRVTNKGMEGLAITPDGRTLVGFMQSPLIQDGGDGGRANRIVTLDIASGAVHEYAYDNIIAGKAYNSSEILALNSHQFLILERDGKGLGDGSKALIKQLWAVDIAGAADVSALSGAAALLAVAPAKTLFLDIFAVLRANGIADTQIPAKLEGIAFGDDVSIGGVMSHTLYLSNDNDFVPAIAGSNKFFVFAFTDADLAAGSLSFANQVFNVAPVANAGANLAILTTQINATFLTGTVSDEDGDALACRWSEGTSVLKDWYPAVSGACALPLSGAWFAAGVHTLTLEATDLKDTASSSMVLTIGAPPPGPVAHWSFDKGFGGFIANDESGHGFDLVALHKPSALNVIPGVVGKALKFAQPGFELEARGSRGAFNFDHATFETMVLNPGTTGAVLANHLSGPGLAQGYWLGIWPGNTLNFVTGNSQDAVKWNETRSSYPLVPGKVYHVTAVLNDNGWNRVYINGEEAGSQPFRPYEPHDGRTVVGYKFGDGIFNTYLTNGAVDELKVYDRALSGDEIRAHYLEVKAGIDAVNP
ncbi:MAG TPA: esterase-like activity of phytase family protein [Fibrobacteria bacterium]|nr:esterase-like activity of phytase family protein [Fibrobacteria bacterium]